MRIVIFSRSWPSNERSGVTLAAATHVQLLMSQGHDVYIAGAHENVLNDPLPVSGRFYVKARGSGALYSPARVDKLYLRTVLQTVKPDLIMVEGWQTALTDAAVDIAHDIDMPVLMISHGISVHAFSSSFVDLFRAAGWLAYRIWTLPRRVARLSAMAVLDELAVSTRFYDRCLAARVHVPIIPLVNSPVNWQEGNAELAGRVLQILVIGYFSSVKNQMKALDVLSGLPESISMRFIGKREGRYYQRCVKKSTDLKLSDRVIFSDDTECNIADAVSRSFLVLSTSVTEALPITLLEAMASGTPFVATPVGAVPSLGCGVVTDSLGVMQKAILHLANDPDAWKRESDKGKLALSRKYTQSHVSAALAEAVRLASKMDGRS